MGHPSAAVFLRRPDWAAGVPRSAWVVVLLLAGLVGCSRERSEARPTPASGALDGERPDVVVLVSPGLKEPAWLGGELAPGGIRFDAAYVRFGSPERNLEDLLSLGGQQAATEWESVWQAAGYATGRGDGTDREALLNAPGPGLYVQLLTEPGREPLQAALAGRQTGDGRVWAVCALAGDPSSEPLSEALHRIPLAVWLPGEAEPGEVRTPVVSLADLGVSVARSVRRGWEAGCVAHSRARRTVSRVYAHQTPDRVARLRARKTMAKRALRSARWRLVRRPGEADRLSYVESDPQSTRDDSAIAGAQAQMAGLGGICSGGFVMIWFAPSGGVLKWNCVIPVVTHPLRVLRTRANCVTT
ncbi:MAG: hypothetical protein R3F17_12505 [Planctomycetota bacterium]